MRRALEAGDLGAAAALEAGTSRRGALLAQMRAAVAEERFGRAAELAAELRVETARRIDVTQDEGSYDRYLDQDDWCAQQRDPRVALTAHATLTLTLTLTFTLALTLVLVLTRTLTLTLTPTLLAPGQVRAGAGA